jgi:hypothetical protein
MNRYLCEQKHHFGALNFSFRLIYNTAVTLAILLAMNSYGCDQVVAGLPEG